MTQDIIDLAAQASKEWMKEYPTPEETVNPVPKRYLEIFAKLVEERTAAKEREACALVCDKASAVSLPAFLAIQIRARGQQ